MSKIVCRWLEKNRLVVNPDGQVHPCCYFANFHYIQTHQNKDNFEEYWKNSNMKVFREYHNNKEDLNIHKNSMKEVLSHDWYTKTLPESWKEQDTRHEICIRFCQQDD